MTSDIPHSRLYQQRRATATNGHYLRNTISLGASVLAQVETREVT